MKNLVFLASLALVMFAANAELKEEFISSFISKIKAVGAECVPETHASKDDISSLLAYNIPDSHEGKCLIFCFHKRFHIQNDDGSIDKAGALQAIEPLKAQDMDVYNKVLNVFQTCEGAPADSDPCVYASNLAQCAIKEGKSAGLHDLIVVELA